MRQIKAAIAGILALFAVVSASAQQFPTVPDHTVLGRIGVGGQSGPSQAIPFASLLANVASTQAANTVWAGPASGAATSPAFRLLVGADLPPIGANTVLGSIAGGAPIALTKTQHTTLVNVFTSGLSGAVPASGGGTTNFLRADGTFAVPGGSGVTGSGASAVGDVATFTNTTSSAITSLGFNAGQIPGLLPTTSTVTITNASPGVVSWTAHGLLANATVYFCTTVALPTGLTACSTTTDGNGHVNPNSNPTLYYVVGSSITANTFQVATSIANAKAGTSVNTSSAGSGTHTGFANVFACAGCVGEYIFNITPTSNANVTSGVDTVFNTISLTAGVWKVGGTAGVFGAAGAVFSTSHNSMGLGITTICGTPYCGTMDWHVASNNANGEAWPFTEIIIPVFSTSSLNAVCEPVFTTATATCFGELHAVRVH